MYRNKFIYIFVLVWCCVTSSYSQYIAPLPNWVVPENIKGIKNVDAKTAKDGYYYLLASEQYNYVLKQNYFHYATKIISEAGFDAVSQLEINFDPLYQKAFFHFIRIHRGGTVIDKTNSQSYKTLNVENERDKGILSGKKTYYRNLDDLRKGDIVEYSYSINGNNPIFNNVVDNHFFFSYTVPVGKIHYRIITAADKNLIIKDISNPNNQPIESTSAGVKELNWIVNNPPIVTIEENTPAWHEPFAQVQISSIKNWAEVKTWAAAMFVLEHKTSKDINELVDRVLNKYPENKADQITELVDFTQNQIRYSGNEQGIYTHRPHQPDFVLKNRFGDCKDKSFFLCTVLQKLGIECYPVLLNTTVGDHVTNYLASLKKFDHCICVINYNGATVFIDPTITMQKGNFLNRKVPDYQKCMILDSTRQSFYSIPSDIESKMIFKEYFDIDDASGDATLKCTTLYYGGYADDHRYTFASNALHDIQENYKNSYLRYTDEVEVLDSIQTIDDTINNVFTVNESYLLKRFWVIKDNAKEINQSILPISLNERIRYVDPVSRKNPLNIYFPVNSIQEITINKQGGWNIKDETIRENNKFFDYEYNTIVRGTEIILKYHYRNKVNHVMPDDYKLYKEKTDFIDKNIVFSPIQTITESTEGSFNWLLSITIVLFLGASLFVCFKFYNKQFNHDSIEGYGTIGGWLILVGLGVCVTPFVLIFQMVSLIKEDIFSNVHLSLLDSSSNSYDPVRAWHSLLTHGLNVFLLISSIFLIFIFFQRKNSFRPYYVFIRCFNIALLFTDLIMLYYYSSQNSLDNSTELNKETTSFIRALIQTCIWVPYIWFSERSKQTFTVGNFTPKPTENIEP